MASSSNSFNKTLVLIMSEAPTNFLEQNQVKVPKQSFPNISIQFHILT